MIEKIQPLVDLHAQRQQEVSWKEKEDEKTRMLQMTSDSESDDEGMNLEETNSREQANQDVKTFPSDMTQQEQVKNSKADVSAAEEISELESVESQPKPVAEEPVLTPKQRLEQWRQRRLQKKAERIQRRKDKLDGRSTTTTTVEPVLEEENLTSDFNQLEDELSSESEDFNDDEEEDDLDEEDVDETRAEKDFDATPQQKSLQVVEDPDFGQEVLKFEEMESSENLEPHERDNSDIAPRPTGTASTKTPNSTAQAEEDPESIV